jgi:hypothetical protein
LLTVFLPGQDHAEAARPVRSDRANRKGSAAGLVRRCLAVAVFRLAFVIMVNIVPIFCVVGRTAYKIIIECGQK